MKRILLKIAGTTALCFMMLNLGTMEARASAIGPMAGFSVLLDYYYTSLSNGLLPEGMEEELTQAVGLTKQETGYILVLDIYTNLGVADVSGYLNIRREPLDQGEIIGKLTRYGGCEILGEENGWYHIKSGQVEGYVSSAYMVTGEAANEIASRASVLMVRVDTETLRIHTEPNAESAIWDNGYLGESYEVTRDLLGGWVEVRLDGEDADDGGTTGYVYTPEYATLMYSLPQAISYVSDRMEPQAHTGTRQGVVDYAMQFLGNPYVWGGTNPSTGSDCSGFVQYVMKYGAGINLDRTSRDQGKQGTIISSSEMRPGDLIFYGNNKGIINHVSLYIGEDQVIHSASKKTGVKISKWNYRTPVIIRNILG